MHRVRSLVSLLTLVALASACEDAAPTSAPPVSIRPEKGHGNGKVVNVMTYNTLHGTQIGIVLSAPPSQIPLAVGQAYALVPSSQPAERMARIADQIAESKPDVVGLQEAVKWLAQRPGDFLAGNPLPATTVEYDLVQLIVDALRRRGER